MEKSINYPGTVTVYIRTTRLAVSHNVCTCFAVQDIVFCRPKP